LVVILAGGTGSVKLARGFAQLDKKSMTVIANVGDNIWLWGLYICPDVDTIMYGLSGMLDERRGWGIKGDTFSFLDQMKRCGNDTWFNIGDRDLATHVLRTEMMVQSGLSLTQVTDHFSQKFGIDSKVLPATDGEVETRISIAADDGECGRGDSGDGGDGAVEMHLQEFWVKNAGRPQVQGVRYKGIEKAHATRQVLDAIKNADRIIISPGNPVSSIGPTLALRDVRVALAKRRDDVVAVSPIIGTAALSGPAVKYMNAMGFEASVEGVAEFYRNVVGSLVIDRQDRNAASKISKRFDLNVQVTNIIMQGSRDEVRLASYLMRKFH
jgi:LPPG:FO 2-phospho-L-lactate transferase